MPNPRSIERTCWTLRIVLLVQCFGLAMKYLWGTFETEADVYGLLLFDWQWPEETALSIENGGLKSALAAALAVWLLASVRAQWPNKSSFARNGTIWLEAVCLIWIACWQLLFTTLHAYRGGSYMAEWAVAAHAVRFVSPLALVVLLFAKFEDGGDNFWAGTGAWLLRFAIAATFVTHGLEAIWQNPAFLDLLIGSANNLLGWALSQSVAAVMLVIIGVIDLILAFLLLTTRWRWVVVYLAFWGFVTASSRITAAGLVGFSGAYPETLIRAANGGAALALFILTMSLFAPRKAVFRGAKDDKH